MQTPHPSFSLEKSKGIGVPSAYDGFRNKVCTREIIPLMMNLRALRLARIDFVVPLKGPPAFPSLSSELSSEDTLLPEDCFMDLARKDTTKKKQKTAAAARNLLEVKTPNTVFLIIAISILISGIGSLGFGAWAVTGLRLSNTNGWSIDTANFPAPD